MSPLSAIARSVGWARASLFLVTTCLSLALVGFLTLYITKGRVDGAVFYASLGASSMAEVPPGQGEATAVEGLRLLVQDPTNPVLRTSQPVTLWEPSSAASLTRLEGALGHAMVSGSLSADGVAVDQTVLSRLGLSIGDEATLEADDPSSSCTVRVSGVLTPKPGEKSVGGRNLVVPGPDTCAASAAKQGKVRSGLTFDAGGTSTTKLALDSISDSPEIMLPTLGILAASVALGVFVVARCATHITHASAGTRALLVELGASRAAINRRWVSVSVAAAITAWAAGLALGALTIWLVSGFRTERWHFVLVWASVSVAIAAIVIPILRRIPIPHTSKEPS